MKGLVWLRSDLRIDDNPALNAAIKKCDEVAALYIFSQSQWEIHCESNVKHEFLVKNLSQLKDALEKLNIPLMTPHEFTKKYL